MPERRCRQLKAWSKISLPKNIAQWSGQSFVYVIHMFKMRRPSQASMVPPASKSSQGPWSSTPSTPSNPPVRICSWCAIAFRSRDLGCHASPHLEDSDAPTSSCRAREHAHAPTWTQWIHKFKTYSMGKEQPLIWVKKKNLKNPNMFARDMSTMWMCFLRMTRLLMKALLKPHAPKSPASPSANCTSMA